MKIFPNPFSQRMEIDFNMSRRSPVRLELIDAFGKLIRALVDEPLNMGSHRFIIDASDFNLANGVYSIQLTSSDYSITRRMILLK